MMPDSPLSVSIDLKDLDLNELISNAIFEHLDKNKKEELIKNSIKYLTQINTERYDKKSPLQSAFHSAVEHAANQCITNLIEKDEKFQNELLDITRQCFDNFYESNKENLIIKLSAKMADWISGERY